MVYMKLFALATVLAAAVSAQTFTGGPAIDRAIEEAIQQGRLPGAVVIVGHDGKIVYRKAYGQRAVVPKPEAMTVDTIFDCASLTKVIATTSSLMKLFEQGRFRLNDKVTDYIPEFQGGKSDITLRNLFTHFSGLQPDVVLKPEWSGNETGLAAGLYHQAGRTSGREARLQRHQFHPAGRTGAPPQRPDRSMSMRSRTCSCRSA